MVVVVDVDLNTFKKFLQGNSNFYWLETTTHFVLIKPLEDIVARTASPKTTPEEDNNFKIRNLSTYAGLRCINFTIDGKELAPLPPAPIGEIKEEETEEEDETEEIDENG